MTQAWRNLKRNLEYLRGYFEFDRNNEFWRRLPQSAGLAIHVTGDLREGMDMECWAVRG